MNNSKFHFALCIFVLLTFLSACSGTAAKPSIQLKPCTVGSIQAECGYLHVPEDRNNPNGRMLDLGTVVVRARQTNHEPDPLFYITGGPGGIDTDPGLVNTARTWFRDVNATRDIVYLDQRGTNDLHRLICKPIPDEVKNGTQQQMNDWMQRCQSGLTGDPRFYTTAEAMRDLDSARAALGYDKINLYGGSYGAAAVQVYMRIFPEHVRTATLDHGTALDLPFRYALPRASQDALNQVFAYCEQDERCHAAYPDIRSDWQKIIDRLSQGPVTTSFIPPGYDIPVIVKLEDLAEGAHQLMTSGSYGQIPFLVHLFATQEDWTSIEMSTYKPHDSADDDLLLMQYVIYCFEPAWGTQPDQAAQFSSGSYYLTQEIQILQWQQKICEALPKPDPSLIYGPGKPAPLSALMFNSLLDPQNPPSNMEPALKEFTKSRMVVEPTEGHATSDSACRWGIAAQYIQQGSVDGLDTSCLEKIKPSFLIGE